ncbi:MAG: transglutaminase domain-containing protein, partial [Bacteroidales bacterium]
RTIKTQFPDEEVVISKSNVVIEFEVKSKHGLTASKNIDLEFIALEKNTEFVYPVFYSEDVKFDEFKAGDGSRLRSDDYYTSNGVFHDDIKVKYSIFKIPLFGSKSDLRARLLYSDTRYLPIVDFSEPIAILEKKVQFIIPSEVDVDLIPMNFEGFDIQVTEVPTKKGRIVTFHANNLESISDEEDMPAKSYIYPHIFIHLKSYNSAGKKENVFETIDDQYDWYNQLVAKVGNETDDLTPVLNQIISPDQSDDEKIAAIFYWVQDNIRYLAFENGIAGFQPASCQKVLNNRYGDCKGMANLTCELLKKAGFDARLAWLGTRHLAYDYSIPSLADDNHMICALHRNDHWLFLDATETYSKMGEYAERIQNRPVLIQNGDSYILETIPQSTDEPNLQQYTLNLALVDGSVIEGEIMVSLAKESRAEFMNYLSGVPAKKWETALKYYLSYGNDLVTVSDVQMPGLGRDSVYTFSGHLRITDKISTFDNETYVYVDPFMFFSDYKLDNDRKYGLWFNYKKYVKVDIHFEVPEGLSVVSVPKGIHVEDDEFDFNVEFTQQGKTIHYHMQAKIPEAEISDDKLIQWNDAIAKLIDTYQQPIILKSETTTY